MNFLQSIYRTHTCNELRLAHVGSDVTISGWVQRKRDHGGVLFVDLRDNYGITQVVFHGDLAASMQDERLESVLCVKGKVAAREPELKNLKLDTGEVEVSVATSQVLSRSELLPFQVADDDNAPESARLKHRFLELRREKLHRNIVLRSKVISAIREIMQGMGFTEFQTPILTSSSPEGARDFIVPSRLHPGKFYALPQAPQQFKQLLMIAGFDRYFQIAPCFRDEDARADRSPGEFYQLDFECSFVEQEDVFRMGEQIFADLFGRFASFNREKPALISPTPFPRFTYDQSMAQFGTDKPDLRNPLRIVDCSAVFANSEFRVFKNTLQKGGHIRALKLELDKIPGRNYLDEAVNAFTKVTGQGLVYLSFDGDDFKGSIAKHVSPAEVTELRKFFGIVKPTVLFVAAGDDKTILAPLGGLLAKLGKDFALLEKDAYRFCWITDFPFYEEDTDNGGVKFVHNPFTMPQGGLEALNTKEPLSIKAFQYDIVCNGYELSSGGIRNHLPEVMYRAFEIVGYSREVVDEKFGGMIRAFKFGAPPHGGFAPGIDRMVMLIAGEEAIRDVIAFPLNQSGEDLLMNAPSGVSAKQLREVHIEVKLPKKLQTPEG